MQVIKRDGRLEPVAFEKITNRLRTLSELDPPLRHVDVPKVAQHACAAVHDRIKTETLDEVTADAAAALATDHPEYSSLAARILVSNLQKNTHADVRRVYADVQVSDEFRAVLEEHADELDAMLDFSRDYHFDYFGFRTLQKAYLMKGERPQHMYLRVAACIWGDDLDKLRETYEALSTHLFTHASPTLFNAGTRTPQLASCELLFLVAFPVFDSLVESFASQVSSSACTPTRSTVFSRRFTRRRPSANTAAASAFTCRPSGAKAAPSSRPTANPTAWCRCSRCSTRSPIT